MDKESLRSTLFFTLPAAGSALIAEIILESAIKPDEVELLLEKNHTRYMVQTIMGVLILLSPCCFDEKKADRIQYLLQMWTPNFLNPKKLASNLRHPIHEVFHTSHIQYPIEMKEGVEYHVVEHKIGPKLVTIDVVKPTQLAKGIMPRVKQLFDSRFYYGHSQYFPEPFELVNRTFVKKGFDKEEYLEQFKSF